MDGIKILAALQKPFAVTYTELDELELLNRTYPYSPLLHALLAKVKSIKNTPDAEEALFAAAVNMPDRSILKSLMNDEISFHLVYSGSDETASSDETAVTGAERNEEITYADPSTENNRAENTDLVTDNTGECDDVPDEHGEEEQPVEGVAFNQELRYSNPASGEEEYTDTGNEDDEMHRELEDNLRALRERRKVLDEVLDEDEDRKKKLNNPTNQLEEWEKETVSDQQASFAHNSQEEQFRLIDQFVTNTPNFEFNPRDLPQNDEQEDLTENNSFSGLVTENYAEIMVRQGKVEQAIEIYRKLIWKNPQKKTYFAKKIEALKKG